MEENQDLDLDAILGGFDIPHIPEEAYLKSNEPAIPEAIKEHVGKPRFVEAMLDEIKAVDEYCWSRGEMGGMDWGYESFNNAFEGLNTGVHLIAGQSNIGI